MTNLGDNFTTMNHSEFTWPYSQPLLAKPSQPPLQTGIRFYEKRIDPDDCKCDTHGFQSDMSRALEKAVAKEEGEKKPRKTSPRSGKKILRLLTENKIFFELKSILKKKINSVTFSMYKQLAEKERRLHNEVVKVNREMTNLVASVLDNCDMEDETMKSVYQTDYDKRGLPLAKYKSLMAAVDSPLGSPINPVVTDLRDGYRDPTRFRYSAIERPTIQPAKSIDHLRIPETFFMWEEPFTGQSEYVGTISKLGLVNMKNRQQYLQPLPSSRRRWGGT